MKKQLLTLATAIAFAATSAFAFVAQQGPVAKKSEATVNGARAATANGYEINFAGDPYSAYTLGASGTYRCYIYITPEIATQLAGNQLTKISLAPALLASKTLKGYVFVSEDIDADPITSKDVTFTNGYNQSTYALVYQTHTLETAYEIKENTGFYFGYVMNNVKYGNSSDYVVGVDDESPLPFAGNVDVIQNGNVVRSVDVGSELECNMLLKATTEGDKKDLLNMIAVSSIGVGNSGFTLPVVDQLTGNNASVKLTNIGTNEITSINYTVASEGGEAITSDLTTSIPGMSAATSNFPLPDLTSGRSSLSLTINKVNGEDIAPVSASFNYIGIDGEGYPRKFVVEEGTGTWCGWCPRGIVGFEYMEANYPDEFIGIAVHNGDAMEVSSYYPIFNYITGFPGALVNRDLGFLIDPSASVLQASYDQWSSQKGIASVNLEAENPADGSIKVTATTTFAFDDPQANYSLAFVTLEDGIMGTQTNYYAGGSNGAMGGWEKKSSSVRTTYKHVARNIFDFYGVAGSIPAKVDKGTPVTFNYDLSLANVSNVDKSSIVVLLLDNASGTILNAAQLHADQYGVTGMSAITEDSNAPVEYYNLQGIRMSGDNLPAGIYVTRQGNKTAKVVVK